MSWLQRNYEGIFCSFEPYHGWKEIKKSFIYFFWASEKRHFVNTRWGGRKMWNAWGVGHCTKIKAPPVSQHLETNTNTHHPRLRLDQIWQHSRVWTKNWHKVIAWTLWAVFAPPCLDWAVQAVYYNQRVTLTWHMSTNRGREGVNVPILSILILFVSMFMFYWSWFKQWRMLTQSKKNNLSICPNFQYSYFVSRYASFLGERDTIRIQQTEN